MPKMRRLARKLLILAVLLMSLAVLNNTNKIARSVAAQTSCCENCQNFLNTCVNLCTNIPCINDCYRRFFFCRSQCDPPCS